MTGSDVKTIFVYEGLTRNQSETTLSEFCPISGDWGELVIPNLAGMSKKIFLNTATWQVYNFYFSEFLRKNKHGGKLPHPG